jgi:hypothetical protein
MNNPWDTILAPSKDVSALRVDADHPLDLYWAKDHLGQYLFVYEYAAGKELDKNITPDLVGIETIPMALGNGRARLVLVLKDKCNWELFYSICTDLLNATRLINQTCTAVDSILRRLYRWQEFLKKNHSDLLSEEKIKGLIGELIFLRNHLIPRYGVIDAVKFWCGPEGTPQDFNVNDSAVEVKCQAGSSLPCVKIASPDQLSSQLPKTYLYVVTLGKTTEDNEGALNLPLLIESVQNELRHGTAQSAERFLDLLCQVNYYHSNKYMEFNYLLLEEQVFEVKDEFPRVCPEDLAPGVIKLSYSLSLADCEPYSIDMTNWELIND